MNHTFKFLEKPCGIKNESMDGSSQTCRMPAILNDFNKSHIQALLKNHIDNNCNNYSNEKITTLKALVNNGGDNELILLINMLNQENAFNHRIFRLHSFRYKSFACAI